MRNVEYKEVQAGDESIHWVPKNLDLDGMLVRVRSICPRKIVSAMFNVSINHVTTTVGN